jgi:hypothetical protein
MATQQHNSNSNSRSTAVRIGVIENRLDNIESVRLTNIEVGVNAINAKLENKNYITQEDAEKNFVQKSDYNTIKQLVIAVILAIIGEFFYIITATKGGH